MGYSQAVIDLLTAEEGQAAVARNTPSSREARAAL
jgi:hypothetical protein